MNVDRLAPAFVLLETVEIIEQLIDRLRNAYATGVNAHLRVFRSFVRAVYAGELLDLAALRFLVEPLRVTGTAYIQRSVDKDLDELPLREDIPNNLPVGTER